MPRAARAKWRQRLLSGSLLLACAGGVAAKTPDRTGAGPAADKARTTHIVRPGEWIWSIARSYGLDPKAIVAINHLQPPYRLHPGEKILLPSGDQPAAAALRASRSSQRVGAAASAHDSPPTTTGPSQTAAGGKRSFPTVTAVGPPSTRATTRPAHTITVVLPLKDGATYLGDIDVTITPDGTISFDTGQALELLSKSLSPDGLGSLKAALAGKSLAPLTDFSKASIVAVYDSAQLQIVLSIPGHSRPTNEMDVADLDQPNHGALVPPDALSGYINFRGSVDEVELGQQRGLTDPLVDMDGALRFGKWLMTGEASIGPSNSGSSGLGGETFMRQGTRLIYDDMKHTLRWTVGDLQPETEGFQGGVDLAGVSVVRLYSELAPQLDIQPRGERSFTLDRAATVETTINGRVVQSVRLDPGTYNLQNFPFVNGANDVQISIVDDAGKRETLNFSIFFDRTLLAPGIMEFGAWAGVASYQQDGNLRYLANDPVFTGFLRRGINDRLTLGANLQADKSTQVLGGQFIWGSPIGTLGGDVAYSHDHALGNGYAINLSLTRLFQSNDSFKSQTLGATIQAKSPNFTQLTDPTPNFSIVPTGPGGTSTATNAALNPYSAEFALTYGRSFGERLFSTFDARYAMGREGQQSVTSVRGSLGWRADNLTNLTFDVGYERNSTEHGPEFEISITRRLGQTRNIRADYDSLGDQASVSYEDSHGRGVGSSNISGDLTYGSGALGLDGSATYEANRAELGIAQTSTWNFQGSSVEDVRTSFRFASAIAFAGNAVAIGRPISDSFAIIEPHPSLNGVQVVADPGPDGALAESGVLGPALLSDIGSYSVRTIIYDAPNAPAGYDIGQGSVLVKPPYRSGYKVVVGSDYSVTVVGRLLDAQGAPISLLAGRAYDLDNPKHQPVVMFTSRDGRFGAEGLRPGRWRIEMPTAPPATFLITVPKGVTGLYRTGDLKPSEG